MEILLFAYVLMGALSFLILYFIIKGAVKKGMLEALNEKDRINSLTPLQKIEQDYKDFKISRQEALLRKAELTNQANQ